MAKKLTLKIKVTLRRFGTWFKENVRPELVQFLDDNKELAISIVTKVAKEYASAGGRVKLEKATDLLGRELARNLPNVKISNHWINLLIEVAVAVLKSQGLI